MGQKEHVLHPGGRGWWSRTANRYPCSSAYGLETALPEDKKTTNRS